MNRWYTGVWVGKNTTFPTSFGMKPSSRNIEV